MPYTLNPVPYNLYLNPYTRSPNPLPHALGPKPCTLRPKVRAPATPPTTPRYSSAPRLFSASAKFRRAADSYLSGLGIRV